MMCGECARDWCSFTEHQRQQIAFDGFCTHPEKQVKEEPTINPPDLKQYIISLRGPLGAGKSTVARVIEEFGHQVGIKSPTKIAFADALKLEVYEVLRSPGHSYWGQAEKDGIYSTSFPTPPNLVTHNKIDWVNKNKKILRPLLQHFGTEYRRAGDPEYWTKQLKKKIEDLLRKGHSVIVDDARFPNERKMLKDMGAVEVFIIAPNADAQAAQRDGIKDAKGIKGHESEKYNDPKDPDIDYNVMNDGDLELLGERIGNLMLTIVDEEKHLRIP